MLKEKGAFNVATKIKRVLEKKHLKLGVKKDKKAKKEKKDGVLLRYQSLQLGVAATPRVREIVLAQEKNAAENPEKA